MTQLRSTPSGDEPADHLSVLELESAAVGELPASRREQVARHVDGCARCRDRIAALRADNERFACAITTPAEVAAIAARLGATRAPKPRRVWPALAAGIAAAALALLTLRPSPPADERPGLDGRTKGALRFDIVHRAADGQQRWLHGGEALSPGDALRFRVRSDRSGFLAVLAIDTAAAVSVYFPEQDALAPLAPGVLEVLPGSIVLDDTLGPERIVAVVCDAQRPVGELVASARAALASARGAVTAVGAIAPVASGCREAAVVVQKVAP